MTRFMMMNDFSARPAVRALTLLCLFVLSACGSQPVSEQAPTIEDHSRPADRPGNSTAQPDTQKHAYAKTYAYPSSGGDAGKSAVADLRERARLMADQGKLNQAAALLERALRIQPRDAWLWYQLADVRLRQKRYPQAESLARKSISLAGQQPDLQVRSWQMIATARKQTGNNKGAEQALQQARELSNQ